jgi:hypothetical protein
LHTRHRTRKIPIVPPEGGVYKYIEVQALNKSSNLRLKENVGYSFASHENFCPVFLHELPQVIREYYICFPSNQSDLPHVILGFEKGVNRYVTDKGVWQASYIPAFIRRYPFILARDKNKAAEGAKFTLAVDAKAPHLSTSEGERLFTHGGERSAVLEDRIKLLQAIEKQLTITREAVREIDGRGLFRMQEITMKSGEEKVAAIRGLRMIDEDKFGDSDLKPGPAMQLVYAHLFSIANLGYGVLAGKQKSSVPSVDPMSEFSFGEDDFIKFD